MVHFTPTHSERIEVDLSESDQIPTRFSVVQAQFDKVRIHVVPLYVFNYCE